MRATRSTLALLLFATAALAAPRTEAERIEAAIKGIEDSKIVFIRNGDEYTPKKAGEYMRYKMKKAHDQVKTFDIFVDELATKSMQSGKPYMVRTETGEQVPLAKWLRERDAATAPK